MYPRHLDFNQPNVISETIEEIRNKGVAVIENVFTSEYCNDKMSSILDKFEKMSEYNFDKNNLKTWQNTNLPPQTRPGMFQCLLSNTSAVWDIRQQEFFKELWASIYRELRGLKVKKEDLIVSSDGINIKPPVKPFQDSINEDWPHVDQTQYRGENYKYYCVQGQVVLTDSSSKNSACFVCSPASFNVHSKVLEAMGNKFTIPMDKREEIKKEVEKVGGIYQTPIHSKKGSLILWTSTTIHSSKLQEAEIIHEKKEIDPYYGWEVLTMNSVQRSIHSGNEVPYYGWRGVVYLSYRPYFDLSKQNLKSRIRAFEENRTMNHWSSRMFNKINRFDKIKRNDLLEKLIQNPELYYEYIEDKPKIDRNLIGDQ